MKFYAEKAKHNHDQVDQKSRHENAQPVLLTFQDGRPVPVPFRRKPKEPVLLREARRICQHAFLFLTCAYTYEEIHHRTARQAELQSKLERGEITEVHADYGKGFFGDLFTIPRAFFSYCEFLVEIMHPVNAVNPVAVTAVPLNLPASNAVVDTKSENEKSRQDNKNDDKQNEKNNAKSSEPVLMAFPVHRAVGAAGNASVSAAAAASASAVAVVTTQQSNASTNSTAFKLE